jgi:phosphonate transport system substrate-binding protein
MRTRLLTLMGVSVLALAGCSRGQEAASPAAAPEPLRFTAIPDQNTTELQEKFAPLAAYLTQRLGVPVVYVPARDYQASVEMLVTGDVGLAWYGGLTGVQARDRVPGARAIAQGDVDSKYYSYFVAHHDTGLPKSAEFPAAIAQYTFTFGSEQSTSGRLMPEFFIRQFTGKAPQDFFQKPVGFSGSHDKTLELVGSGQYQAGVVNYKVYDDRVAQKKIDPNVVRVIWRTPPYADYNWTIRPDLDQKHGEGFAARLAETLVGIEDPALLTALPRDRLVPATNEDYAAIREVAMQLGMIR